MTKQGTGCPWRTAIHSLLGCAEHPLHPQSPGTTPGSSQARKARYWCQSSACGTSDCVSPREPSVFRSTRNSNLFRPVSKLHPNLLRRWYKARTASCLSTCTSADGGWCKSHFGSTISSSPLRLRQLTSLLVLTAFEKSLYSPEAGASLPCSFSPCPVTAVLLTMSRPG